MAGEDVIDTWTMKVHVSSSAFSSHKCAARGGNVHDKRVAQTSESRAQNLIHNPEIHDS